MDTLPDFDDMIEMAGRIKELMILRDDLERQIKEGEANVYKTAMTDKSKFENGKPPSVSYVKALYEYTGFNNELIPLRQAFAVAKAELEFNKAEYEVMRSKIDIYRTESANKRAAL